MHGCIYPSEAMDGIRAGFMHGCIYLGYPIVVKYTHLKFTIRRQPDVYLL